MARCSACAIAAGKPGVDFSIVGCDDVQEAAQWYPALTTIKNFQEEMGRKSAEFLIRRIAEPDAPTQRLLLTPELVVRGHDDAAPALSSCTGT